MKLWNRFFRKHDVCEFLLRHAFRKRPAEAELGSTLFCFGNGIGRDMAGAHDVSRFHVEAEEEAEYFTIFGHTQNPYTH